MNKDYSNMRGDLVCAVKAEMVGPGSEGAYLKPLQEEIISEAPLQRYSIGILYPRKTRMAAEEDNNLDNSTQGDAENSAAAPEEKPEENEYADAATTKANEYYPSSMGTSFYASGINPRLKIIVEAAKYRRLEPTECSVSVDTIPDTVTGRELFQEIFSYNGEKIVLKRKISTTICKECVKLYAHDGYEDAVWRLSRLQQNGWKRIPLPVDAAEIEIPAETATNITSKRCDVWGGLRIACMRRPNRATNVTLFTISLINGNESGTEKKDADSFFQVGFSVIPQDGSEILDYGKPDAYSDDNEEKTLNLTYRKKKMFAVGHGCAVSWAPDHGKVTSLRTETIPVVEVPQLKFDVDELHAQTDVLSMQCLSNLSRFNKTEIIEKLRGFAQTYKQWINGLNTVADGNTDDSITMEQKNTAEQHIGACNNMYLRICKGIDFLEENVQAFHAFQLANCAMLMQRAHTILQEKKRFPDDAPVEWPIYSEVLNENASWRPFQLAYILLTLESVANKSSLDRDVVDLIWFPTGGGKTEAYLGLSAFTIFLRRIKNPMHGQGTTILMRYTLRLLTAQQFQRAGTLICACEQIRKDNLAELGKSPITIGLWIGQAATPNNIADAFSHLDALVVGREDKNPFQVLTCPWCGTKLVVDKQRGNWGYKRGTPKQFLIHCTEKSCAFSKALPILVVDEDIYNTPPTLLFGTVDKFAMLPWKTDVSRIFAMDHGNLSLSPELIIQDELHLISGPLGSVVGLYETAIDALCSAKGVKPKIIASTATIRRAGDQIKAVYARKVSQFPSPGIDAGDSFFAREAGLDELPGRLYVGVMAAGKTMTTTQIRLMSGLLQYTHEMQYPPEIRDKYWTLVGYFNTIRELGKCATFVDDDIKEQVKRIASRRKCHPRLMYQSEELYSMKSAEEIPVILEKMAIPFPDKAVIDVLLASNMISVGVDINRLGLMVVVGQPKTTGEYIQATSRVGRKFPGLILTIFDGARARDRSHYERFTAYHNAFYRYVEPTSVTPFAGPARDRALKAVLVSLIRHWTGLSKDNAAGSFQKNMAGVDAVRDYILDRVAVVMPEELQGTKKDIDEAFDSWQAICNALPELQYAGSDKHLLYTAGRRGRYWPLLKSMRSVDVECNLSVRD